MVPIYTISSGNSRVAGNQTQNNMIKSNQGKRKNGSVKRNARDKQMKSL